jgi:hypothetical protein
MPLELGVDAERLVVQYLLAQTDVAALVSNRVTTDLDKTKNNTYPLIRITRTGGVSPYPQHLDHPRVYIECYGNTKAEAHSVMRTARAAMLQIVRPHALGIVTSSDEIAGPVWLPDPIAPGTPELARYIFSFALTTHPFT